MRICTYFKSFYIAVLLNVCYEVLLVLQLM